ncbi:non-ribosomal peptide synthetase/type I polyketide synthase [Caldimonas thermodepolymerans]|uniref:non-ribosomal peptide synthetase/type I polyketide synthase n=1 Tax=Caldimonas thermodepolymerans TaxID=215580 RepID=UPI001404E2B3|nr:non-ribosomal peptide synthetase/type I polyketide synthase [Caldimonas thermodepolymerans]UZG49710.1 non-ribosomal peptide synthetase [Caldimonas thermodepolymerans]
MHLWLHEAATRWPERPALVHVDGDTLDYRALAAAVTARAREMSAAGLRAGDRVALAATRSIATVVDILAAVEAGVGYVPLDLGYPADRLAAMLEDARPRTVLGEPEALARLEAATGKLPTLAAPAPPGLATFGAEPDLTYVLFTSGSTGRPKGVAMGARPLRHLIAWHAEHPRLGQPAVTLQFAPLSFDVHFQEIFSTLACGGTLVLVDDARRRDPARLCQVLLEQRVERIFLPYVALQMLADAAREVLPRHLRDVVSAGEQLQVTPAIRWLFGQLADAVLHNHYGPTESHVVTAHELHGDPDTWPVIPPIGRALPHVQLALRDGDGGALIDAEAGTGELLLGGDTLAHGYLGREDLSRERFRDDIPGLSGRWYTTGDLVQRDADGTCTYLGRADQQLKVDGFRIEPGEIEVVLMAHEAVREAVVTAPELPGIGKQLMAHLVLRPGHADTPQLSATLRAHLRERLPEYMVPVRYMVLERLPTTPSGKIDRRHLPLPEVDPGTPADAATLVHRLWEELLGVPGIPEDANLFELGAKSLLVLRFVTRLREAGVQGLSVADVYDRPTIAGIRSVLEGWPQARRARTGRQASGQGGIAIVGMATRTAGARNVEEFWDNLVAGREGIRHFRPEELDPSIPESLRSRSNFVAARGVLDDVARFDAGFFGIPAREATVLDPQQRLFLELCWSALEHAAIDPGPGQRVGVYGGVANNTYITALRQEQPELIQQMGEFAAMLASEKDYVATRVANRLNLDGPAVSVHTACSTGLVAVALAAHALAGGQCDVALAGGATVIVPQEGGYLHVEGGMESADGHCRPFDADASGTVFASGGAVVVLKRLEDALADGDTIYAVIRGIGLNNDGGDKASFTAPSVTGQAGAIRMALEHANVSARSIGYVEAHGTGTALGDPIEVSALTRAWQEDTQDVQFCGIGSLKSNLGHTIAAAGVLGLIKAALSLHRELIPGTLHFRRPNPQIDFASTPFRVIASNTPWPRGHEPRRAAVSSFGVGGTNAHLVLEEAPAPAHAPAQDDGRLFLLPLSARTADAALQRARDLADHLERHPGLALADVAATLMRGRRPMPQRLCAVAGDTASAVTALRALKSPVAALAKPRVVFLFPGQGSQHPGMARRLYDEAPAFRVALDRCFELAGAELGPRLRQWMVAAEPGDAEAAAALAETRHAQPALFALSYALTAWLDSLCVQPDAMIGHSIGEYAAACHAGVLSVEDAMAAVIARGAAMYAQPPGAMLAARAGVDTLLPLLPAGVEIAGCNAPGLTVLAGDHAAIDATAVLLESREIGTTRLRVSHAFHSASMEGALPAVEAALSRAPLRAPQRLLYSCVSGAPLQADEATQPAYWARQVRATVQFTRAVQAELDRPEDSVFIEVGSGQALTALLRQHRTRANAVPRVVPLLGPANDPGDAALHALKALGALWCTGVAIAWPVAAGARRVPLPTYPFQGERYWFKRRPPAAAVATPATASLVTTGTATAATPVSPPAIDVKPAMSRLPRLETELKRILSDVSGVPAEEMATDASFVDQGLDSLSLTQATLELERVFGVKLRFRRLLEDLDTPGKLARFLDGELPADRFAPEPAPAPAAAPVAPVAAVQAAPAVAVQPVVTALAPQPAASLDAGGNALHLLLQQQMQLMSQQLALLAGQPLAATAPAAVQPSAVAAAPALPASATTGVAPASPAAQPAAEPAEPEQPSIKALIEKPFGAAARITLDAQHEETPEQRRWLEDFIARYNARTGKSKAFSQQHRKLMADPRVVTGFNPLWKDLVYPIVADRSKGARIWDIDGNEYIDLLSCFGANLLGYQPDDIVEAMMAQLQAGIEVGPQHPLAAEVAQLISEFTGHERVAFCNTGSEAVMGAMRIARTVTGRKTIAIFTNSYHGIFDEVIVRGTRQLRSISAAPGILANAVENVLVLDYASEESLRVLRERGPQLAAIMIEPIQNKCPTLQPREFVQELRRIADASGCALIFDEVVTGFRVAPGGAQEFYGVRADICTYGKVIGGGLPFAAIAGRSHWMDALDGGHWQYGDDSYPEAGVTYFAGTFVRHPLALAAARAALLHLKRGGRELYRSLNERTQRLIDRLNTAFAVRGAPVKAVHCASLWRLAWDDGQKYVSLFYYLVRYHGLHLYEQFGHFVTDAMGEAELDRIFTVFTSALDELMALGFIKPRPGSTPPGGGLSSGSEASGPLTPGQTERWLAGSFDPHARRALNESLCLTLRGDVDLAALEQAVRDVIGRHEAFRLRFDLDEPRQVLDPQARLEVQKIDLRSQPDADAALDAFCTQASEHDFPLDQAPLAAVSLLQLFDGRVVVHLVASHLVFDGWASTVMLAELAEAYRARLSGNPPVLPAAESPRRFAAEEVARMDSPRGREDLAYWSEVLRDPPPLLSLGDRTPPAPRRYAADTVRAHFDAALHGRLLAQARRHNATLFQLLLTAVSVVLARRSGQQDFVVSIPYAGQSLQRHGPLIADGVLDLPLRLRWSAGDDARTLLAHVRDRLMDALEHPLVTQGTVARALNLPAKGDRPAFSGVFFNLNPRIDLSGFAPLEARTHEGRKRGLLSELFFNFYETADGLTLDLHHSSEYYSLERAGELVRELQAVCTALADSLELPVAAAPAPAVDARLLEWNAATAAPLPPHPRVEQWVSAQAAQTPDRVAVEAQGRQLTYRELESRANRIAQLLHARGVGSGQRVGLCLGRSVDLLPALLAVLKTGAAYVPLDPNFPRERLQYMQQDAGLGMVITESRHAELVDLPRERQLRVDEDEASIAAASDAPLLALADAAAPAYVIYTSGSTGKPKGVVVLQRGVVNFLASMQREPGLRPDDRLLAVTTLSFDIAVLELLLPLVTGARTILAQREDAMDGQALAALIAQHGITIMQATPTTWHLLLDEGWKAPAGFRALCGGEALPPALARRLLDAGVTLWNMYGPTETTVWSTVMPITSADDITIGRPIANTTVWILDEQGRCCPIGEPGEICIGGAGVAGGYWNRPDLTAERFFPDPFAKEPGARLYRTGDLGRWREDGRLDHMGRLDHQVKVRGYRIELGEIEAQLDSAPGVSRSVVVTREDQPGDVRLVAYAVPAAGTALEPAALRAHLKKHLPDYMVPTQFVAMAQLPLLPNGKIDRKALPVPPAAASTATPQVPVPAPAPAPAPAATAAPDAAVQEIARLMGEVLGTAPLQPDDHFFELGGHSLLAARLAARLSQQHGRRIGLKVLFDAPTPRALAAALAPQSAAAPAAPVARIPAREDQRSAPLSLMQQRIWFLEQLTPGTAVHNLPSAHRLKGPMNVEALERALQMLVDRQSALRTYFEKTPDGAVQRVLDRFTVGPLPLTDLQHLPQDEREAAMQARCDELATTPFLLEQAPLFSVHLFRMAPQEHVLFFMVHHAVWDGWSFDLFYVELAELYAACCAGRAPRLPELPVSYGDYAAWQRDWMQGEELARQTAHWKERLSPLPAPLELPLDHPRPPRMSGRGASHCILLSPELTRGLHALAQRQGRTLFATLLAAYSALLYRVTQQEDFVIGTPVRGREQPELEPLMGFFVNALPLRLQPQAETRFRDWLERVHEVVVDAFAYPDVPLEHLVRELNVPRDPSRPMVFQALFSFQDVRERPLRWADLSHERAIIRLHSAAEDIGLWCVETPSGVECNFTYAADLFEHDSIVRLAAGFEQILQQVVADAERPLAAYPLLSPADRIQLARWNDTGMGYDPAAATIPQLLAGPVQRHPAAVALRRGPRSLTYAELEALSNRLAHALRARGISRGQLVGLCLERSPEMLVAQLAILKAGAAYVPLDPAFPAERLAYMAQDAQLALLLTQSSLTGLLPWPRERTLLVDADAALLAAQPDSPPPADELAARPEDAAYVIYTSGSTGRPKGVVVPHRAVVNFLLSMARAPGLSASDRLLAVTTLSFDIAVLELLLPLSVGAQIVLASRDEAMDGQALCALLLSSQATVMQATPATWRMLVEAGWAGSPAFKALIGGEPLPPDLAAQLLERCGQLWNMYGPTETTVWSTIMRITDARDITIGRPIANTQVHILDPRGQPCPIGVPGEICIGGDGVTLGYLRRPELTAERFIDDPWRPGARLYRTGDRGRWRHDGLLEHHGRMDFQVKVRGYRIELGEIEANLATHPQVARNVVIVREDRPGDARLVAYVVPRDEMPGAQALREHLRQSLPEYMLPQHYVQLQAIPLLPNGKIDRKALPAPTEASADASAPVRDAAAPRTPAEAAVAEIWKRLLGIEHVSPSDNFFDLGGHSLLAMRAVGEMEAALGSRIPVRRLIFETLAQLAETSTTTEPPRHARTADTPRKPWFNRLLNAVGMRTSAGNG